MLRRALDLQFFASQHIDLGELTLEEAIVIRVVESERQKLADAEQKSRELEMKAR